MADNQDNNENANAPENPVPPVVNPPEDDDSLSSEETEASSVVDPVAAFRNGLNAEIVDMLDVINGQDAYNATAAAVGRLSTDHYLKLPDGLDLTTVHTDNVGAADCVPEMSQLVWAQIYHLNKEVFDTPEAQVKGALLRAELVKTGWVDGTYEVLRVPVPATADVIETLTNDVAAIRDNMDAARQLAYLLPLAAEHVFRTMGHHYLTALDRDYTEKYARFFQACVLGELTNFLPPPILFHRVAHWVSLKKALEVAKSTAQVARLPNAVVIRASAGPAGTAILTTSQAILGALDQAGLKTALEAASGVDLAMINDVSAKVRRDPGKYHTIPMAYQNDALSNADRLELENAKAEAIKIAPVLQGFLDSLPRNSDLPKARALRKHAEHNPLLTKRAKVFFREAGTTKATSMAELFAMTKRGVDAVGGTDVFDDEEE